VRLVAACPFPPGSQAATGTGSGEPRWHTVVSDKGGKVAGQVEAAVHWEEAPVAVIDPAADLAEEVRCTLMPIKWCDRS
jgi:hypothetical protein